VVSSTHQWNQLHSLLTLFTFRLKTLNWNIFAISESGIELNQFSFIKKKDLGQEKKKRKIDAKWFRQPIRGINYTRC